MNMENIKISSLTNNTYEVEESKKSKGKVTLIDKIKTFKEYIQNVCTYKANNGVERLTDARLDSYIEYLNNENININKAIDELHQKYSTMLDSDNINKNEFEQAEEQLEKLTDKKQNIEQELAEAESEKQAREDFNAMEQENEMPNIDQPIEGDEMHEIESEQVETEDLQQSEIDYEAAVESTDMNEQPEMPEEIQNEQSDITEVQEEQLVEHSQVEQQNSAEELMSTIQNEYIESIDQIETSYKEQFGREFSSVINAIMEETEKYANRQVTEIGIVARKAIDNANNNTQRVLEEKAVVENDRDQYKAHYEQTLEVVKQRNETIDAKDAEIESLKQELAKRDEMIADKDRNIEELNNTLIEKNNQITDLEADISNYKITISTIIGKSYTSEVVEEQEIKTR